MSKRPKSNLNEKCDGPSPKKSNLGPWANGLLKSMENPELVVKRDDLVTVIKDAYPKAEFHYLILPKQNISSLKSINKENLHLLKYMDKIGKEIISEEKHNNKGFKMGYHAQPSMARLHLHVISNDMNSPCLKTKKHWNSFTTDFFLESKGKKSILIDQNLYFDILDVIDSCELNGKVIIPSAERCKKLMDSPLKCHKCQFTPKNIPDLKKHILGHL